MLGSTLGCGYGVAGGASIPDRLRQCNAWEMWCKLSVGHGVQVVVLAGDGRKAVTGRQTEEV
ncbi:hypothetical protein DNK34_20785 [Pseudomonas dryadis]|uniref:Uncharacterized protein n=1 Tax=Phytopseudomonas dryadis TaxID=2487520 RepID=A0A4Q9QTB1_9GAMM|nr:hypothetical protein DNK44_23715 [Pseudomonas dryadis]TBV01481.1 hypothetical protein DNK34_20785 [Pseudomonas dryadis]TBV19446.1 hypothetical protein DNK41_02620 [Pseudomonas sp. FRB 230]